MGETSRSIASELYVHRSTFNEFKLVAFSRKDNGIIFFDLNHAVIDGFVFTVCHLLPSVALLIFPPQIDSTAVIITVRARKVQTKPY